MNEEENKIAQAILKIADAIDGHSESIDGLAKQIQWCFRTDFDENVADAFFKINNQFVNFNRARERKAKDG